MGSEMCIRDSNAIEESFNNFKALADKKKNVYDEDIIAIVDDQVIRVNDFISLKDLSVIAGTKGPQTAEVTLLIDNNEQNTKSTGDGPVDAIFNALMTLVPHKGKLQLTKWMQ